MKNYHKALPYILAAIALPVFSLALIWIAYFGYEFIQQQRITAHIAALKCPEDYKTEDEKMSAFNDFSNSYASANPKAYGDWHVFLAGRADFLIKHHCTATLMRFGYDGVSPIGAQLRQQLITAMEAALGATLRAESSSSPTQGSSR